MPRGRGTATRPGVTLAAMIQEVDEALEALVRRDALNGSRVEVLFDAPTKDWVARRNAPTLDIYLYDIREDTSRRQIVPQLMRDEATHVAGERRMPPRRFRLSYLVTAWTQRPEDEHRLLSACLATFVRNETIPTDLLSGSLASSSYPIILSVGLPVGPDRSIADVWSAMGGELKPSLDLVATAPLDAAWSWPVAAPVMEGPTLGVGGPGMDAERRPVAGAAGRPGTAGRYGAAGGNGAAGRGGRGPLGPDDEARQSELIRSGGAGVRRATAGEPDAEQDVAAGPRKGRKVAKAAEGVAEGAAEEAVPGAAEEVVAELAGLGAGRIVRVRGISRP